MVDVVVVGAGLSGLTAAYRLAVGGASVCVLEARQRTGGRAWRVEVGGVPFDAGCEAIDAAHAATRALAGALGVAVLHGEPWHHGEPPPELEAAIAALAARIDPEHPEETEGAAALDAQTLGGWLRERGASPETLERAELAYSVASSSVPVERMSLLAHAAKVAAGAAPNGLALRLHGGPSALAARLGEELEGRVRLAAAAVAVEEDAGEVAVRLAAGAEVRGRRAVLAVPLTLLRAIRFRPALPEHRLDALKRARYGAVVKAAFSYDEPPASGLPRLTAGGLLYRPDAGLPLVGLFAGAKAAARPEEPPGRPGSSTRVDWRRERWTRGSYLVFGPGDLTGWGYRLREASGRLHFAGAETSALPSYVEGAVRAGERVAAEVLAAV